MQSSTFTLDGDEPQFIAPEVCDPECDLGQCCINGQCHCFNSDTVSTEPCEGIIVFVFHKNSKKFWVYLKLHIKSTQKISNFQVQLLIAELGTRLFEGLDSFARCCLQLCIGFWHDKVCTIHGSLTYLCPLLCPFSF